MNRHKSRATLVALLLLPAGFLAACGDGKPAAAPPAPAPVEAQPAAPVETKPVAPPPVVESIPATELVPATPVVVTPEPEEPAPSAAAERIVDQLGPLRDMVAGMGVELSDDDLAKVASYVDGAVTEENVTKALQQFGADNPESAVGALADKLGVNVPGLGGSDAVDDAAGALKEGLGGKAKADVVDPGGAKEAVAALSIDQLKAERKAAIAELEVAREAALTEIRATFAERSRRNPAKAAEHAAKLAEKEKAIVAEYDEKVETTRAEYKARIAAAR